ncbi:MAG: 50S ribosomal protein L29 [Candidatus Micrarchaeaceae archaeon]
MFKIKIKEIRALPDEALEENKRQLELELAIEKRKIASTGVSSKIVKTRAIKKTIARIETIKNMRQKIKGAK